MRKSCHCWQILMQVLMSLPASAVDVVHVCDSVHADDDALNVYTCFKLFVISLQVHRPPIAFVDFPFIPMQQTRKVD